MNSTVDMEAGKVTGMRLIAMVGLASAIAMVMAVLSAGSASAAMLKGGSTSLKLDPAVAKALTDNGVAVAPVKPAKVKKGAIAFPITGGKLNTKTAAGTIRHSGGLSFKAGGKKLVATKFTVKTGSTNKLSGLVGGARVNLLNLDLSKAKLSKAGKAVKASNIKVSLTSTAAKALNSTFGVSLFKARMAIGTVVVVAVPKA